MFIVFYRSSCFVHSMFIGFLVLHVSFTHKFKYIEYHIHSYCMQENYQAHKCICPLVIIFIQIACKKTIGRINVDVPLVLHNIIFIHISCQKTIGRINVHVPFDTVIWFDKKFHWAPQVCIRSSNVLEGLRLYQNADITGSWSMAVRWFCNVRIEEQMSELRRSFILHPTQHPDNKGV